MPAMRSIPGIAAILLMNAVAQAQTEAACPVISCATPPVITISSGVRQAEQVKLTVTDAIALAEQHAGGKVVQASLLLRGGNASYTVVALPNVGEVWRGSVDANSGTLIDERVTPLKDAAATDQVDPTKAKLAEQARLPLPQAVERAEAKSGGRVFDASLENANGRPVYQMQVARGDDVEDLVVDPADGAVTLAAD
jgi:uncharacterized membrane protein YkoI